MNKKYVLHIFSLLCFSMEAQANATVSVGSGSGVTINPAFGNYSESGPAICLSGNCSTSSLEAADTADTNWTSKDQVSTHVDPLASGTLLATISLWDANKQALLKATALAASNQLGAFIANIFTVGTPVKPLDQATIDSLLNPQTGVRVVHDLVQYRHPIMNSPASLGFVRECFMLIRDSGGVEKIVSTELNKKSPCANFISYGRYIQPVDAFAMGVNEQQEFNFLAAILATQLGSSPWDATMISQIMSTGLAAGGLMTTYYNAEMGAP